MIEFKEVSKNYDGNYALNNVSFTINEGEIFGLIGHNGAGKSTAIKSLVSIINPSSGEILIDGSNLQDHRDELKKKIGYVADSPNYFLNLAAGEYWEFVRVAYGVDEETAKEKIETYTSLFNLQNKHNHTIESFSHGMRQKVFLIGALLVNPKIWVMDEPMTGLDPQAIFDLKKRMKDHADEGNIVLFSSHDLNTAQEICDHIVILKSGEITYDGTIEELREQNDNQSLEHIYLEMVKRHDDSNDDMNDDTYDEITDINDKDTNEQTDIESKEQENVPDPRNSKTEEEKEQDKSEPSKNQPQPFKGDD